MDALQICYQVRQQLHDNGIEDLSLEFPIEEMKDIDLAADCHYLGFCHNTSSDWELIDETHKRADTNIVHKVEICLVDPVTQEVYALERVLPTLLHEFAHCIAPGIKVYGHAENGKPKRQWTYERHSDTFYTCFSRILDVAEKLGIYKLPAGFSKNSTPSLRRFDRVDVDSKNLFVGHTEILRQDDTTLTPHSVLTPHLGTQTLKVVVGNEKGETKLIVLKGRSDLLQELCELCVRKFQIKKKKGLIFKTQSGHVLASGEALLNAITRQESVTFGIS